MSTWLFLTQGRNAVFTASASPTSVTGSRSTVGTATSTNTTCTPSGGTAPYSYDWEYVSGDATITSTADTSATTAFSATVGPSNPARQAVWRCKVTATGGAIAYSNNVSITLEYII